MSRPPIELSALERRALEDLLESRASTGRQRLRARIVLRAAAGMRDVDIAVELGASRPTVALWRRRFAVERMEGLLDAPRTGRPRTIARGAVERVLAKAAEPAPEGQVEWSVRQLASATGLSASTVHRILRDPAKALPSVDDDAHRGADGDGQPRSSRQRTAAARRELILRSAASVISEKGFAHTTMALVAREAGVSTGMLNHYFANRSDMLTQTLESVSDAMQAVVEREVARAEPGVPRFEALLESWLPNDPQTLQTWRIFSAAYGETVHDEDLRETIESRLEPWHELLSRVLSELAGGRAPVDADGVPLVWRLNALANGLVLQTFAAKPQMTLEGVRGAMRRFVEVELGCGFVS